MYPELRVSPPNTQLRHAGSFLPMNNFFLNPSPSIMTHNLQVFEGFWRDKQIPPGCVYKERAQSLYVKQPNS